MTPVAEAGDFVHESAPSFPAETITVIPIVTNLFTAVFNIVLLPPPNETSIVVIDLFVYLYIVTNPIGIYFILYIL